MRGAGDVKDEPISEIKRESKKVPTTLVSGLTCSVMVSWQQLLTWLPRNLAARAPPCVIPFRWVWPGHKGLLLVKRTGQKQRDVTSKMWWQKTFMLPTLSPSCLLAWISSATMLQILCREAWGTFQSKVPEELHLASDHTSEPGRGSFPAEPEVTAASRRPRWPRVTNKL